MPEGGTAWDGDALVTGLVSRDLRRIDLDWAEDAPVPVCQERLLDGYGRLRLLRPAPDGSIWVGTSNEDQIGPARGGGDLILRLTPPSATEQAP